VTFPGGGPRRTPCGQPSRQVLDYLAVADGEIKATVIPHYPAMPSQFLPLSPRFLPLSRPADRGWGWSQVVFVRRGIAGEGRTDGATIVARNSGLTFFLFSCRRYISRDKLSQIKIV